MLAWVPAVLAWLCLQVQSKHMQIHVLFFTRTKQPCTFPTIICGNLCTAAMFKTESQQWPAVQMANTGTSIVDGYEEKLFRVSGPIIACVLCICKRLSTLNFDFWKLVVCQVGRGHQHWLAYWCSPCENFAHTWSVKFNIIGIWEWGIYGLMGWTFMA